MANITLTNLPTVTSLTGTEPLLGVQSSASVQITVGQIATYANAQSNITPIGTGDMLANISGSTAYPIGVSVSDYLDYTITNVAGSVMYRSLSTWTALPPGILGQALTTNGPLASPQWRDFSGGGTVLQITAGTNLSATPANPITSSGTISTVMNPTFTTSVTTPLLLGGATASSTLTLQSTSGIGTSDAISFKVGNNGATTAMTINTSGNVGIGTSSPSAQLYVQSPSTNGLVINQVLRNPNGGSPVAAIGFNVALVAEGDYTQAGIGLLRSVANGSGSLCFYNKGSGTASNFTTADEKMRIDSSGNVGIGTSSPSKKLDVFNSGTTTTDFVVRNGTVSLLSFVDSGAGYTGTTTSHPLLFTTAGSERMRIDSSGNVGIGTTNSSAFRLAVVGGRIQLSGGTTSEEGIAIQRISGAATITGVNNDNNTYNSIAFKTSASEAMRIDTSGNVGIGTTSPSYKLDIQAATATTFLKSTTGTNYAAHFLNNTGGFTYLGIESSVGGSLFTGTSAYSAVFGTVGAYPVAFATSNTERMRIDSSGNVGIGASSPVAKLDVLSSTANIIASRSTGGYAAFQRFAPTGQQTYDFYTINGVEVARITGDPSYFSFSTGSSATERMRIDVNGNVSIGPTGTSAFVTLLNNDTITGGTTAFAQLNSGVIQSGVTATAYGFSSGISSAAAAFTLSNAVHFIADPNAGGAGSTISNQFGFYAQSTLGTAGGATVTNAYGFYGNIASAANRWNLYMTGTANNYMAGSLGIGTTSLTGINLAIGGNITGATSSNAIYLNGVVQSGVTSAALGVYSNISLAAAAFTTTSLIHFYANPATGGAGSTVTNQYGFIAESTLGTQGGATVTNAYGFYGAISAASNKYNIYTAGTANNYFAGYSFGLGGVQNSTTATATNTATLTATQVASGFIVGTPTATASYTLPTAASLDTELSNSPTGTNFELVVFTTAAFAITLLTATGWTLVGSMATGATANSFARFRARKTGGGAWSLYRIS